MLHRCHHISLVGATPQPQALEVTMFDSPTDLFQRVAETLREEGILVGVGGYDRILLGEAERCAKRAEKADNAGNANEEAGSTAASVLTASAACEARLSEHLSHWNFARGPLPEDLKALRGPRLSPPEKWKRLLKAEAADLDLGECTTYDHLGCLYLVRNVVAHRHARGMEYGDWPDKLQDCVAQGLLPMETEKSYHWTSVLFRHPIARWATETAASWLNLVDKKCPMRC